MEKRKIMVNYNTDSFIIFIIAKDIYVHIGEDVDTSKYEVKRPLPRRRDKKK